MLCWLRQHDNNWEYDASKQDFTNAGLNNLGRLQYIGASLHFDVQLGSLSIVSWDDHMQGFAADGGTAEPPAEAQSSAAVWLLEETAVRFPATAGVSRGWQQSWPHIALEGCVRTG